MQYFNARYYDPSIGTFVSPDTIVPSPGAVVSYNRFAYARANPLNFVDPSGHCEISTNENGDDYISKWDCSVDDFAKLTWQQRKRWTELFMSTTGVPWFQNILGILDYFEADQQFSDLNGWASVSDAGVLQAINDGWVAYLGGTPVGPSGEGSPSQLWNSFFESARRSQADARSKWGAAEQAGVNYGVGIADGLLAGSSSVTQQKANSFKALGDVYRLMVINQAHQWPGVREAEALGFTPLDPRTSDSRTFVALAADAFVSHTTNTYPATITGYIQRAIQFCPTGNCVQ